MTRRRRHTRAEVSTDEVAAANTFAPLSASTRPSSLLSVCTPLCHICSKLLALTVESLGELLLN